MTHIAIAKTPTIIDNPGDIPDLAARILNGEVFIVRRVLQKADVYNDMLEATRKGLAKIVGEDSGKAVEAAGFERIHEHVSPQDIPAVTDAIYAEVTRRASPMLDRMVGFMFSGKSDFYFETDPNVRFHIPFNLMVKHKDQFDKFAEKRGQGKVAPHGPHRDPWLDCPLNVINVWIAVGPVMHGNGLTVFPESYRDNIAYSTHGEVTPGQRLLKPMTFELQPGDTVLFHSNHVHGSEINRTDFTRYVVSYRISFEAPQFPHGHYHSYTHAGLARGSFDAISPVPANLQWSYVRSLAQRVVARVSGRGGSLQAPAASPPAIAPREATAPLRVDQIPVGAIVPYSSRVVVARLSATEFVATSRTCPHKGGDLADGFVDNGRVVCPWHNLPFDAASGRANCQGVRPLLRFPVQIVDGEVLVDVDAPLAPT